MREGKNISIVLEEAENETKVPLIFQSFVELVLGVFLIIYRDMTTNIIFIIIGALMVCYGVFDLIAFVTNNRPYSFRRGLTTGVLITIIGVAFIVQAEQLKNLVAIIIGALILIESIVNCRRAFILKNLGSDKWSALFTVSLVVLVFSIFICIYPNIFSELLSLIIGIAVILLSIIDIITIVLMLKIRNSRKSEIVNVRTSPSSTDVTVIDVDNVKNNR